MKILIVKPSSLGDVVQAMPVLRVIKRQWPRSEVYWWIEASLAPLLENDPDLSGLFLFDRKNWMKPEWWPKIFSTVLAARAQRFQFVLDLQGLIRSGVLAWLANGETVIGLDNPREGNREGAQMFYDVLAPPSPPLTPAPERYLGVLKLLGLPVSWDFDWLPPRTGASDQVREQTGDLPGRLIVLLPGARWINKRWPAEYFAETVKLLAERDSKLTLAILGTAGDAPLARIICQAHPSRCLDLTGRTTLPQMIEWLRRADLVISNDTGPMHVAAALGRPVVAIYGPSDPRSTGPHRQRENVLQVRDLACVPCMKQTCAYRDPLACLKSISPELVCERACALLGLGK